MHFMFIALFLLLFSGCTNWRALYYESQAELIRCQNSPATDSVTVADEVIIFDDNIIDIFPDDPPARDTITVSDTVKIPVQRVIRQKIRFKPEVPVNFQNQDTHIFMTLMNQLIGDALFQSVRLDSVHLPVRTITRTKTVQVFRTDWGRVTMAAVAGFFAGVLGVFLLAYFLKK